MEDMMDDYPLDEMRKEDELFLQYYNKGQYDKACDSIPVMVGAPHMMEKIVLALKHENRLDELSTSMGNEVLDSSCCSDEVRNIVIDSGRYDYEKLQSSEARAEVYIRTQNDNLLYSPATTFLTFWHIRQMGCTNPVIGDVIASRTDLDESFVSDAMFSGLMVDPESVLEALNNRDGAFLKRYIDRATSVDAGVIAYHDAIQNVVNVNGDVLRDAWEKGLIDLDNDLMIHAIINNKNCPASVVESVARMAIEKRDRRTAWTMAYYSYANMDVRRLLVAHMCVWGPDDGFVDESRSTLVDDDVVDMIAEIDPDFDFSVIANTAYNNVSKKKRAEIA